MSRGAARAAEHTPGPWRWEHWAGGLTLCAPAAGGGRIMGCLSDHSRDWPRPEDQALIAAAPDLLAALKLAAGLLADPDADEMAAAQVETAIWAAIRAAGGTK